ncbi:MULTISPECIES: hypothetical protein [Nocardioides]|uniref:WXG100 family type VII secretion target n=1 Tax=Nocardioides vastitatis TaxID=2568655 RepID=A0ABW0ZF24_9ACTN|nr:hypothetical protein [Nocardioides sp.]THI96922.1 hypothetical protein E7Z54_15605 [Nocardioides sp.]
MGVTLDVPAHVLQHFKGEWDAAADKLDGAWRRLAKASTDGFAREVVSAVEQFQDAWVEEIKRIAGVAQGNSDAFVLAGDDFAITDRGEAERLRSLLSWGYHDAKIRES